MSCSAVKFQGKIEKYSPELEVGPVLNLMSQLSKIKELPQNEPGMNLLTGTLIQNHNKGRKLLEQPRESKKNIQNNF